MDFIEGLPFSKGFNSILVVVDRLNNNNHFFPLKHPFTTKIIAEAYIREIVRSHEFPETVVSDRDKVFLNHFWTELFKFQGVAMHRSFAYHPQTDGQTEVVNRCLETYLRCFTNRNQPSGLNGCPGQSTATTPLTISLSRTHHSLLSMEENLQIYCGMEMFQLPMPM